MLGLGYGVSRLIKVEEGKDPVERWVMRLGIGIAVFILLGVTFSVLNIPLHWWLFLLVTLAVVGFSWYKEKPKFGFKLTSKSLYSGIMLVIFIFSMYMYLGGAHAYPYLEDDDPWSHALGVSYIAQEKSILEPRNPEVYFQYFDPYPPGYDLILAMLYQTSGDMYFTLKFFNALFVSLGALFFYFFARQFMGSSKKALFAAFCLAMIPAFLSHFIWAISLSVTMYFVAFYAAEKIKDDKKWWWITALAVGGNLIITPTHSTYFGLLFLGYVVTKCVLEKKLLKPEIFAGLLGVGLSLLWWGPTMLRWGLLGTVKGVGFVGTSILDIGGTGDRGYSISDFVIAQKQNMINSPVGIGLVVSILVILGIIALVLTFKKSVKDQKWLIISGVWFIMMFYAVNAASMPIKISPFRTWMLLAIPVCLLAAQGMWLLLSFGKKVHIPAIALIIVVVLGIWFTSGVQKYTVNTAQWPPGAFWQSGGEIETYLWLRDQKDVTAFTFFANGAMAASDKYFCPYCDSILDFQTKGIGRSPEKYRDFLINHEFDYLVIGAMDAKEFGVDLVNEKIVELQQSGFFRVAHQGEGSLVLAVV
jgi:hypothetical protein